MEAQEEPDMIGNYIEMDIRYQIEILQLVKKLNKAYNYEKTEAVSLPKID